MNLAAVYHRETIDMCYALDKNSVVVNIKTGKDADAVYLVYGDPFSHQLLGKSLQEWSGERKEMTLSRELKNHYLWTLTVTPKYKRLMYYFELVYGDEVYCLYENDLCPKAEAGTFFKRFFKYAWINPADVITPPAWVEDVVWYHIMPDRFYRDENAAPNEKFRDWNDYSNPELSDFYGGTLRGITEKLDYVKDMGFSGLFITPVNTADSNHKYNPFSYQIDPDFGTEDDMRELVRTAHEKGIRIMLDIVPNQCGDQFGPWLDVLRNGKESKYYDWFFINSEDFAEPKPTTEDGRFFSYSFYSMMPKFNSSNPEVIQFFSDLCCHWISDWDVDGLRFDVGGELSHTFVKAVRKAVKAVKPDAYLPAEIFMDSINWVNYDEYDGVTNFPFSDWITDFWNNKRLTARDFMYRMNYIHSLYPEQINRVMFNFVDNHDLPRVLELSDNFDVVIQKLIILMTMAGTPSIYYGTELLMKGMKEPATRETMPWDKIERGDFDDVIAKIKEIVAFRNNNPECKDTRVSYEVSDTYLRLIAYTKGSGMKVYVNAGDTDCPLDLEGTIVYANKLDGNVLRKDGVVVTVK